MREISEEILDELKELRKSVNNQALALERIAGASTLAQAEMTARVKCLEDIEKDRKDLKKQVRGYVIAAVVATLFSAFALIQGCQAWMRALADGAK